MGIPVVLVDVVGPPFPSVLRQLWSDGAAVFPLDPRLPTPVQQSVLARVRPTHRWSDGTLVALADGADAAEGDAVVLATSGTTATPKGVVLTHAALEFAASITSEAVNVDPQLDRWLCCSPVAHAAGFGVINRALRTGTPLEVLAGFDAAAVDASTATLTAMVPTVLKRIHPERFRMIILGAMAIPDERPPNTVATYGLTETMGSIVYAARPLRGCEVRIVDGIIEMRSPTLLRCYRTEDGEVDPKSDDGWLRTGDAGEVLGDGTVVVHGRADDVIITGGQKVWPAAVEAVIRTVPGVGDALVVGRPDPEWGQQVVALIEAEGTVPTLDLVRGRVKEQLPPWCAPRAIEILDELPRTASGKLRRRA